MVDERPDYTTVLFMLTVPKDWAGLSELQITRKLAPNVPGILSTITKSIQSQLKNPLTEERLLEIFRKEKA